MAKRQNSARAEYPSLFPLLTFSKVSSAQMLPRLLCPFIFGVLGLISKGCAADRGSFAADLIFELVHNVYCNS
jgi:hypothetical protein